MSIELLSSVEPIVDVCRTHCCSLSIALLSHDPTDCCIMHTSNNSAITRLAECQSQSTPARSCSKSIQQTNVGPPPTAVVSTNTRNLIHYSFGQNPHSVTWIALEGKILGPGSSNVNTPRDNVR